MSILTDPAPSTTSETFLSEVMNLRAREFIMLLTGKAANSAGIWIPATACARGSRPTTEMPISSTPEMKNPAPSQVKAVDLSDAERHASPISAAITATPRKTAYITHFT